MLSDEQKVMLLEQGSPAELFATVERIVSDAARAAERALVERLTAPALVEHIANFVPLGFSDRDPYDNVDEAALAILAEVAAALRPEAATTEGTVVDLVRLLAAQREWSSETFGPGSRLNGVLDHIRKELTEVEHDPTDVTEWIDVVILAFDGAWRAGHEPEAIAAALVAKYAKNRARTWPDWRTADPDKAIEHTPAAVHPDTEGAATCPDCKHIHTPDGCTGPPSASDLWAGVSPRVCDCADEPPRAARGEGEPT